MSANREDQVSIQIRRAENTKVIGIQEGPTSEEIVHAVEQALTAKLSSIEHQIQSLLTIPQGSLSNVNVSDKATHGLFVCEADGRQALGFAVNHSGLIVCPSVLGDVSCVTHLQSGDVFEARLVERQAILQATKIETHTYGLVPAYVESLVGFDIPLFAFDRAGMRVPVRVTAVELDMLIIEAPNERFQLDGTVMADFESSDHLLMGGPVLTEAEEIFGVSVGVAPLEHSLIIQPWARLPDCLSMDARKVPKDDRRRATCQSCGMELETHLTICPHCQEPADGQKGE